MKHFTISFNSPHSLVFCLNKSAKKVESKWTAREHFCPRRHCGSKVCDKCRTFCSAVPAPSCFYTIVDQLWPSWGPDIIQRFRMEPRSLISQQDLVPVIARFGTRHQACWSKNSQNLVVKVENMKIKSFNDPLILISSNIL